MQEVGNEENLPAEHVDLRDFSDGHTSAILSALHFQHKLFLREMQGNLYPVEITLDKMGTVLDFICGPGSWCMDFSKKHPDKRIYGVDVNPMIIDLASENAEQAATKNLTFHLLDRADFSAPFENETFDLIHVQNGTSFFTLHQWPGIMTELCRLLRPGGWLNLIDFEIGPTSELALERVLALLGQILDALDRNIAPRGILPMNGCTLGPQRMFEHHLTEIGYRLYPVNLGGWNNPIGRAYLTSIVVRPEMILRLAVKTGVSTQEELQPLLREMLRELQRIGFCGVGMLVSSFGRKPLRARGKSAGRKTQRRKTETGGNVS